MRRDLRSVLDEELNRLSENYRSPIVLCYLQGHTQEEAAEILGCPPGTVWSRLARGLEQLRIRFRQRGLALSAGCLSTQLVMNSSSAMVPATLVDVTMKAAATFAAGDVATGLVSSSVAALTQGVCALLFIANLKKVVAVMATVAVLGLGISSIAPYIPAQDIRIEARQDAQPKKIKPAPTEKTEKFFAKIKKVEGNKVTINRSDKDNKFADQVLTATDKVKVSTRNLNLDIISGEGKFTSEELTDGLKNAVFAQEVRAHITVDAKRNITEIQVINDPAPLEIVPEINPVVALIVTVNRSPFTPPR